MAGDMWGSRKAFVFAAIGSAVGLGNVWRFPYIASENGGVWFLVPYAVCIILVGLPLLLLETGQGLQNRRNLVESAVRSMGAHFPGRAGRLALGAFPVFVSTVIMAYYAAICAWTLWFAFEFALGATPTFGAMQKEYSPLAAFAVVFAGGYFIAAKGAHRGIEPVTNWLVPALFLILALLFAYALALPGALAYLEGTFSTGAEKLLEPRTWYYALSQVLFSLSVGYGIMFTYATSLRSGRGLISSSLQIAGADTAASVLAFLTITILASSLGNSAGGMALSFEALPVFFAGGGWAGVAAGVGFFLLLFFAAFTSYLSMLEHTLVSTKSLNPGWKAAVAICTLAIGAVSVLSYSPLGLQAFGKPVLDLLDFAFGTVLAPFSALALTAVCAYLLPTAGLARRMGLPEWGRGAFDFAIKKAVPAALLALIAVSLAFGLY